MSFPNTTRGYRRMSLAALACLPAGQQGVILTLLPNTHSVILFSFRVDGHAHRHTFAKRRRQRLLIVITVRHCAVSVVIVITAICDMPREEFSLCERVYLSQYVYEKMKVVFSNTTQISSSFQDGLCLIPVQLGDRLKEQKSQLSTSCSYIR